MWSRGSAVAGLLIVVLAVSVPGEATACSPAICQPRAAPAAGKPIPANAPAVALDPHTWASGMTGFNPESVVLTTESGSAVPFTIEREEASPWYVVRAGWQAGQRYTVLYPEPCSFPASEDDGGSMGKAVPSTAQAGDGGVAFSFTAGPVVEWPATSGELGSNFGPKVVRAATSCGSCTTELAASAASLAFQLSPELSPFAAVTRYIVSVDGEFWASSSYGPIADGGDSFPQVSSRAFDLVYASCDRENPYVGDHGLTPGTHVVSLQPHIAGAATQPPSVSQTFHFDCAYWDDHPRPQASCMGATWDGGWTGPQANEDGGVGPRNPEAGGCSGMFSAATLLAVAVVLTRRAGRVGRG